MIFTHVDKGIYDDDNIISYNMAFFKKRNSMPFTSFS